MAGVACFSGRITSQHTHTDVYAFVPTRQAYRLRKSPPAAPSQRLGSTRNCRQGMIIARAALAMPELGGPLKVDDVMTKRKLFSVREDTSIDEGAAEPQDQQSLRYLSTEYDVRAELGITVGAALDLIVAHRISGLPVLDAQDRVVGVVSDYDLLSLDAVSGKMQETGFFPRPETNWDAFHQIQKLVLKNAGKSVADVMTESPIVVRPTTDMTSAARLLLDTKVRRLPVVDDDGHLVGIFTRGDVIKAALEARRSAVGSQ